MSRLHVQEGRWDDSPCNMILPSICKKPGTKTDGKPQHQDCKQVLLFFSLCMWCYILHFSLDILRHTDSIHIPCDISVLLFQLLTVCSVTGSIIIILNISAILSPLTPFPRYPLYLSSFHWSTSQPPVCNCNINNSLETWRVIRHTRQTQL